MKTLLFNADSRGLVRRTAGRAGAGDIGQRQWPRAVLALVAGCGAAAGDGSGGTAAAFVR